jgi:hypothetical protein
MPQGILGPAILRYHLGRMPITIAPVDTKWFNAVTFNLLAHLGALPSYNHSILSIIHAHVLA